VSDHNDEFLTEDQAAALWKRAAMLQSEALQQAESARREEAGKALSPASRTGPDEGYALEHVRAAGIEAGISEEFLEAALTDMRAATAMEPKRRVGRLVRSFIGDPPEVVTLRRLIDAPPEAVLRSMEELLPMAPYNLTLVDRTGDPLNGGVLTFNIEGAGWIAATTDTFTGTASGADFRQVLATLRVVGEGDSCEVTLHAPVAWAQGVNAAIGAGMVSFVGAGGFFLGSVGGSVLAGALVASGVGVAVAAAAAAASAVGGTLVAAVAGTAGFQKLYEYSLSKGRKGLEGMIAALALKAQGGWGLTPPRDESEPGVLADPRTRSAP
jgi:hypothetical protein